MNNPLVQKYNYYLNESYRLSEELKTEESYSELLENVLFELLGEEDFTKLFEYVMKGNVTHDGERIRLTPAQSARRADRIGKIIKLGQEGSKDVQVRAGHSLVAKGVEVPVTSTNSLDAPHDRVVKALQDRSHGEHVPLEVRSMAQGGHDLNVKIKADDEQKYLSAERRKSIQAAKQKAAEDKAAEAKQAQEKKERAANTYKNYFKL